MVSSELRAKAEEARALYRMGMISKKEAKIIINPYIDAVNEKSRELAKKYQQKPRYVSFEAYCR